MIYFLAVFFQFYNNLFKLLYRDSEEMLSELKSIKR
jgi:hypothetical protein